MKDIIKLLEELRKAGEEMRELIKENKFLMWFLAVILLIYVIAPNGLVG